MKHLLTLLFSLFLSFSIFAQSHADCAIALEICDKQPLTLPLIYFAGDSVNELDNLACFNGFPNIEISSAWIRWHVSESGTLWFVIFPLNPVDDLDFAVFKLPNGDCTMKETIRCMAAGDISEPSACMGPTGLLPGETDLNAPAGCIPGANNFLAPLNVSAGTDYVLAINNFSSYVDSIRIEFCGTALLGCETAFCNMVGTNTPGSADELSIGPIVPNPIGSEMNAAFQINADHAQKVLIQCLDVDGRMLHSMHQNLNSGANTILLESRQFPAGVYFVTIIAEQSTTTRRLVKK